MGFAKSYSILLLASFTALLTARTSDACICSPTDSQTKFCKAQFVVLVNVQSVNSTDKEVEYAISVVKEYKIANAATRAALQVGRLYTPPQTSMCSVPLLAAKSYVVSGWVEVYKPTIDICRSLTPPLDHLTEEERKGIEGEYIKQCDVASVA